MNDLAQNEFDQFSDVGQHIKPQYEDKLWQVDDKLASRMDLKFIERDGAPFMDYAFDSMGQSPLEYVNIPPGLIKWLEVAFMKPFRIPHSEFADLNGIIHHVFRHLDYCEPYFFLTDMPISLTDNHTDFTYQMRDDKSVFDPFKTEVFTVNRGWKFQHYQFVHDFLQSPQVRDILAREYEPRHPAERREYIQEDVFRKICESVYGDYEKKHPYTKSLLENVSEWILSYYDEMSYKAKSIEEKTDMEDAMIIDRNWWVMVSLGILTWLKSPYGLKFLTEYHPVYMELLEWDNEIKKVRIRPESGGEVIVTGWALHTLQDVEKLESVPPGTCCVTGQALHCTERINATFIHNPQCYCGQPLNFMVRENESDGHNRPECRKFRGDHPDKYVFISYGALDNILQKRPMATKCDRHTCPNTQCSLHAGYKMRVNALTNNRTKMLTSSPRT